MTDYNGTEVASELNPRPIRSIRLMGMVSITDWALFIVGVIVVIAILLWGVQLSMDVTGLLIRAAIAAGILLPWAAFCFIQNKVQGKVRTRMYRYLRNLVKNKNFSGSAIKSIYNVKDVKANHIAYRAQFGTTAYASIFRLNGFNPILLQTSAQDQAIFSLQKMFEAKFRFKIISVQISYKLPRKKFNITFDHPGINYAKNTYVQKIKSISEATNIKEQGYFIVVESDSVEKNIKNIGLMEMSADAAHLVIRPANEHEMEQLMNNFWFDTFNPATPNQIGIKRFFIQDDCVQITKNDGTREYMSVASYSTIPEMATPLWLTDLFNSNIFDFLIDINDVAPQEGVRLLEEMGNTVDSLIQTKWFRKRATDNDRLRVEHVKDQIATLNEQLVNSSVSMKQVVFYLIFKGFSKKQLRRNIADFKSKLYSYNTGWQFFDCKYLQYDGLVSTRINDIPNLQYVDKTHGGGGIKSLGQMANAIATSGSTTHATSSLVNKLPIVHDIDHYLLSTALGLGYPFVERSDDADENSWFKGFDISSGMLTPIMNNYWKINEMYNSFNRFYQGRNGSGKSWTANLDMVEDRLDDRFIISIDPKPERVVLTKNLGGENIYIGDQRTSTDCINIFDVLVVPTDDNSGNSNPLTSQYQANLLSISTLLSLNPDTPDDKIILSCFNDVQQYIYENVHGFTYKTDFDRVPRNQMPIMREFYTETMRRIPLQRDEIYINAYEKLSILLKEHAIGISADLFNRYSNIDWSKNKMWNFIVKEIALNYGNKNILACWVINIIRVACAFMIAGKKVVLYIDELHLIHNINGVLQRLDEFARIDRSFKSALCLINQNFNSIRSTADLKKKEYYESIFTMSQYNLFFTTGEEDVQFLVEMLSGSGQPLSDLERQYMTQAGRGKALLLMTAFDRYRIQFDVDYWSPLWEKDLEPLWSNSMRQQQPIPIQIQQPVSQPQPQPQSQPIAQQPIIQQSIVQPKANSYKQIQQPVYNTYGSASQMPVINNTIRQNVPTAAELVQQQAQQQIQNKQILDKDNINSTWVGINEANIKKTYIPKPERLQSNIDQRWVTSNPQNSQNNDDDKKTNYFKQREIKH